VYGELPSFDAAIIQAVHLPDEPTGFGSDPEKLFELLVEVDGWQCIDLSAEVADAVGPTLEAPLNARVRYLDDIYQVLDKQAPRLRHPAVRLLGLSDLPLLESAPEELQGAGFRNATDLLETGIMAGAVVSEKLVSIAHVSALSERYADVGVFTSEGHRGQGYAAAAASLVAQAIGDAGRIPVWSCGANNEPSLRIARKLGFREVSRRRYLILDRRL